TAGARSAEPQSAPAGQSTESATGPASSSADGPDSDAGEEKTVVARKASRGSPGPQANGPKTATAPPGLGAPNTAAATARGEPPAELLDPTRHPWARYPIGAWRELRTVTESFDLSGKLLGRSEATRIDTLIEVSATTYTLQTVSTVNIGGKDLRGGTQQTTLSLLSDAPVRVVAVSPLPAANVNLNGRVAPCTRWLLESGAGPGRRLETIYYNASLAPFVLRREASSVDGQGASVELQKTTAVVRLDVPISLEGGIVPGRHVSIESQLASGSLSALEVRSDVVPGGLVSASRTERDTAGRRVRWETTQLVRSSESGPTADAEPTRRRWRLFGRAKKKGQ
ncbi:MAG: hypothetical protein AAF790_09835, partial [Planctomycetota bacterium]